MSATDNAEMAAELIRPLDELDSPPTGRDEIVDKPLGEGGAELVANGFGDEGQSSPLTGILAPWIQDVALSKEAEAAERCGC